jgi:hypothetical protein
MQVWESFKDDPYVGLEPWVWVQLETAEPPGPFPFVGGVAPEVVAALHEAHGLLQSCVDTAISDVFSHRAPLDDPARRARMEDAYAELVNSRPHLKAQIQCGRNPDGSFYWDFHKDASKSAVVAHVGLRIFNAVARQAIPIGFERPVAPAIGKFLGLLDGTHRASELKTVVMSAGRAVSGIMMQILEALQKSGGLSRSSASTVRERWLAHTRDQDVVHLGHAGLLYRQQDRFFLFDPWLLPWFAESSVPSLWDGILPRPAAIFLTHDHDDHVDPRTLLHMPKDVPVVVPSKRNRRALFFDYSALLRELGFSHIVELAHGERWAFDGGSVVAVPFFGEDPCDLEMPRNCYLIADRGRNTMVHVDSGPTNDGKSVVKEGVMDDLVRTHGPIALLLASQQQLRELRAHAAYACFSHPGRWLETGENGYLPNSYLAELARVARAKQFVSYATGGADWLPDHLSFTFSRRNPARTALITAHWESPEALRDLLAAQGCGYHYAQALDAFRAKADGSTEVVSLAEALSPLALYRLDRGDPPFLKQGTEPARG